MAGEILLDEEVESRPQPQEEGHGLFGNLEQKVLYLLAKFHELAKDRDRLAAALDREREKVNQLEKKMKLLSQDREKVKTRIDQLLHRFKSIDS